LIEVWNKLDKLDADHRAALAAGQGEGSPIAVSALTGEGIDALLQAIETRLARGRSLIDLDLESADGQGLHWLYEHTEVMARRDDEDGGVRVTVRVPADAVDRVKRRFGAAAR
jgi:GTP-binding protein HflX